MKDAIRAKAEELGFAAVGFCSATAPTPHDPPHVPDMAWLDRRLTPRQYWPECKTVVATLFNSRVPDSDVPVAAHARGRDYHATIREKLLELAGILPGPYRICIDASPLKEKALAVAAGLGWKGRNSLLINPDIGPWGLIGLILTPVEIEPDEPMPDRCGDCTACRDDCSYGAIEMTGKVAIEKCAAYLTIESRAEEIPPVHSVYGCDICLAACPFGRRAPVNASIVPLDGKPLRDYDFCRRLGRRRLERNLRALRKGAITRKSLFWLICSSVNASALCLIGCLQFVAG